MIVKVLIRNIDTQDFIIEEHKGMQYFDLDVDNLAIISDNDKFTNSKAKKWALVNIPSGLILVYASTKKQLIENYQRLKDSKVDI